MTKEWFKQRINMILILVPISIEGWALYGLLAASIAFLGNFFSIFSAGAKGTFAFPVLLWNSPVAFFPHN